MKNKLKQVFVILLSLTLLLSSVPVSAAEAGAAPVADAPVADMPAGPDAPGETAAEGEDETPAEAPAPAEPAEEPGAEAEAALLEAEQAPLAAPAGFGPASFEFEYDEVFFPVVEIHPQQLNAAHGDSLDIYFQMEGVAVDRVAVAVSHRARGERMYTDDAVMLEPGEGTLRTGCLAVDNWMLGGWPGGEYYVEVFLNYEDTWDFRDYWEIGAFTLSNLGSAEEIELIDAWSDPATYVIGHSDQMNMYFALRSPHWFEENTLVSIYREGGMVSRGSASPNDTHIADIPVQLAQRQEDDGSMNIAEAHVALDFMERFDWEGEYYAVAGLRDQGMGGWYDVVVGGFTVEEPGARFNSFSLPGADGTPVEGEIEDWYQRVEVDFIYSQHPAGMVLAPTFTASSGATVTVAGVEQVSGVTTQDFSQPVVYTITSLNGETEQYTVYANLLPASGEGALTSFALEGLPEGTQSIFDLKNRMLHALVPRDTEGLSFTPVFTVSDYAAASLVSGQPVDFTGTTEAPMELVVTAENGATSTYRLVVGHKEETPLYFGTVYRQNNGATTPAGREVRLIDGSRRYPTTEPLAITHTDENGYYAFYTNGMPGLEDMRVAVAAYPLYDDTDGVREYDTLLARNVEDTVNGSVMYAESQWATPGQPLDFYAFSGKYQWRARVVDDTTGEPLEGVVLKGAASGGTSITRTSGQDGWLLMDSPLSIRSLFTYFKVASGETVDSRFVFTARKEGWRDQPGIKVPFTPEGFDELIAEGTITIPEIRMVRAETGAKLVAFTLAGHQAVIDEEAGTVVLHLPFVEGLDLAQARPAFTLAPYATADRTSGTLMDLSNSEAAPVILTVTSEDRQTVKTYAITVTMQPDIQVAYTGTMRLRRDGENVPAAHFTFQVVNTWLQAMATVTTDANGNYTFTVGGAQANRGMYLRNEQSIGTLLKADLSGFAPNSYTLMARGEAGDFLFATLDKGRELRGLVQDEQGSPLAGVSVRYISELATTGPDGSFRLEIDTDWMRYHATTFTFVKDGYGSKSASVAINTKSAFMQMLDYGYISMGTIPLATTSGSPVQSGSVTAVPQYTQRAKTVEVHARFTPKDSLQDAVFTVTVPAGVAVNPASLSNPKAALDGGTITLAGPFEAGESYGVNFWVSAGLDFEPGSFPVAATLTTGGGTWAVGQASVLLTDLTLEVPQQVGIEGSDSLPFTISGEATAGAGYTIDIEVYDPDGNPAAMSRNLTGLPTTGVGPWYKVSDVRVKNAYLNPGRHLVVATLRDGAGGTVAVASASTQLVAEALKKTHVNMHSTYFNVTAAQPVTNSSYVTACAYVNTDLSGRDTINITSKWENDSAVVSSVYVMETSSGVYLSSMSQTGKTTYSGRFTPGTYAGSGTANIYIEFGLADGSALRFLCGRLTLLYDPSGYVYDSFTGERVEGATATLEYQTGGRWVQWPAEEFGQHNPQTTDAEGAYGWFVPEGEYRVVVSAEGYKPYSTDLDPAYGVIDVLPPRDDIYIGLQSTTARLTGITADTAAMNTEYVAGQPLDLAGLAVTAGYSDGTSRLLGAAEYTTDPADGAVLAEAGEVTVSVAYAEGDYAHTASFTVTVAPKALTGIEVSALPDKTGYFAGEALELAGLVVTAFYNDGTSRTLAAGEYTTSPAEGEALAQPGEAEVLVRFEDAEAAFTVAVAPVELASIAVTAAPAKTAYIEGEALELDGMEVTALYTDGSSRVLGAEEYTTDPAAGEALATVGILTVGVSCTEGEKTARASFEVRVEEDPARPELTGLSLTGPAKTAYTTGEALDLAGLEVTATYSDGGSRVLPAGEYTVTPAAGTRLDTAGEVTVTVAYVEEGVSVSAAFTVAVAAPAATPSALQVGAKPAKTAYTKGEALDLTGLVINLVYSDGSSRALAAGEYTTSPAAGAALNTTGTRTVTVTWQGEGGKKLTASFTVEVKAAGKPGIVEKVVEAVKTVVETVVKVVKGIFGWLFGR